MRVKEVTPPEFTESDRLARLEERVARLEAQLGAAQPAPVAPAPAALRPVFGADAALPERLDDAAGQKGMTLAAVAVLTAGMSFLICLPYPALPAGLPSLGGLAAGALLLLASRWQRTAALLPPEYLRAAAIALVHVATLRLFLFGVRAALDPARWPGGTVVLTLIASGVALGIGSRSAALAVFSFVTACGVALGAGGEIPLLVAAGVAVTAGVLAREERWRLALPAALVLVPLTCFLWALGNPLRGGGVHLVAGPAGIPALPLALMAGLGIVPLLRRDSRDETPYGIAAAALNCALGYGLFLVHTAVAFRGAFAGWHGAAAAVLLALAILYYLRQQSRFTTFFYAMTAYAALSLTIIKLTRVPNVFVWLSLQSLVVVGTAVLFRSRFIVVMNFGIFAAIVGAYLLVAGHESGVSAGFGVVALATARILKWQQGRLELRTEVMRNAYLASAFLVFPYALFHLVPRRYVGLAWVGLAALYYVLHVLLRNAKYRWMGHATLALASVYVVAISVRGLDPVYRVLSFLALGVLLWIVSRTLARPRSRDSEEGGTNDSHDRADAQPE